MSLARSITALLGFFAGAAIGGRIMANASAAVQFRAAGSVFALEIVFLVGATLAALGYGVVSSPHFLQLYAIVAFTAIAMGMRNAAVRKLAVPDLTTTVLTLTLLRIRPWRAETIPVGSGELQRWWRCLLVQQ